MFASQLLRILQTIPSDAKRESCVYDSAEQDTTMKENPTLYQSQTLQREDVPPLVSFESNKEIYVRETNPPLFDAKGRTDELWRGNSTGEEITIRPLCRVSSLDEDEEDSLCSDKDLENLMTDQIRPVCRPSSFEEEEDDDVDSESFGTNAKEKEEKEQEYPLTVEEFTDILSSESSPFISPVDLFETDTKPYDDDENESEYEKPEIIVCYKEINYHVVEDLRMNMSVNDDDNNTEEASDMEVFVSDEFATSSSDNTNRVEVIIFPVEEDGSEEESRDKLLGQESPAFPPSENPTLIDASEKRSFVDKTLPIQEFGTRSFLRSFINSFDGDDSTNNNSFKVEHLQDQEISSSEAGPKGDHVQASSLSFKSKVENGSITFNFKSPAPAPAPAGVTKPVTENIEEQSIIGSGNPSNATTTSIGEIEEEKPLKTADDVFVFSDDYSSTTKKVDKLEMEIVTPKTIPSVAKESSSDDGVSSSGKSVNSVNSEVTLGGSNFLKRDEGETSFSAGGLITFSGPAAYSGSISHRSDGSATSGRSFAFPVLQEEWNSSPERIPKEGVGRDFRKHKGWRSGLLCCRF
ncbi:hypothetical protein ABFS82_05G025000 [Erythranthe guttata]|uniref:uncharacterized protein LOC105974797 n=1 Tax=Erythranthe guttata TaxID=4155 RepID=UPI00064D7B85|nr:PREDICTED: uncharacterized protein LOC105974797 [Erythranthe guttata]XP_012855408.1 PREDICTED: uncharacterized protein LOC105974797 [Erythranthe guttata]|eukprot:XP_012855407.1 PREDICTED: uncharacterized protein LOC105974797 [Erythranthe guttata]